MQQPAISEGISRMLNNLKREVARDTWNLSRDDHDAIEFRIDQLE